MYYASSARFVELDGTKYGKEKEQEKEKRHVETRPGLNSPVPHFFFFETVKNLLSQNVGHA